MYKHQDIHGRIGNLILSIDSTFWYSVAIAKRKEYDKKQRLEASMKGMSLPPRSSYENDEEMIPTQDSIDCSHPLTQEEPPPYVPGDKRASVSQFLRSVLSTVTPIIR